MSDILHDLYINATSEAVYAALTSPAGLDAWWTLSSHGEPTVGTVYELGFGAGYDWRATVTRAESARAFEFAMSDAMPDWMGTRVSFELERSDAGVQLHFAHRGWPSASEHFRISSYCWAMYLRLLKRYVEYGETVPYSQRLEV